MIEVGQYNTVKEKKSINMVENVLNCERGREIRRMLGSQFSAEGPTLSDTFPMFYMVKPKIIQAFFLSTILL